MLRRNRAVEHHAGDRQCLGALIVKHGVHIGNEAGDPGIEIEPLTQTSDQSTGYGLPSPFAGIESLAQRTNPQVRRACDGVRRLEGRMLRAFFGRLKNLFLHPGNLVSGAISCLSISIIFDSISFNYALRT